MAEVEEWRSWKNFQNNLLMIVRALKRKVAGSWLPMGRKKNRSASLLSFISFPRKRTKGRMSRRHLFSPPSLSLIISQPCAYPAGHIFIGWKKKKKNLCPCQDASLFFWALVGFYWHKLTKIEIVPTIFSELYKLSRDSGPYLNTYSKTVPHWEM